MNLDDTVILAMNRVEAVLLLGVLVKTRRHIVEAPEMALKVLDDQIARLKLQIGRGPGAKTAPYPI